MRRHTATLFSVGKSVKGSSQTSVEAESTEAVGRMCEKCHSDRADREGAVVDTGTNYDVCGYVDIRTLIGSLDSGNCSDRWSAQ